MLFSPEKSELYISRLKEFLSRVASDDFEYSQVMVVQLSDVLAQELELMRFGGGGPGDFNNAYERIGSILDGLLSLEAIEVAHYEFARLLRIYSFGGHHNFNESGVVRFYLAPKFDRIKQKKIDEIRFNIPASFILSPIQEKMNAVASNFDRVVSWDDQISKWDEGVQGKLAEWKACMDDSEARYNNIVQGHNYLGLAHAFNEMIKKKTKEASSLRVFMIGLAILTLLVPVVQLLWGFKVYSVSDIEMPVVSTTLFSVAAEVLLIYYFRLCHLRWVNTKNQVAQLELRHSMCAFVQDYANKSKNLDRDTLVKFENMIFAEVSSNSAPPPSIYDAVDSIAKLLAAWKKPGA